MTNAPSGIIIFAGFMAWGMYRRIRRNIGRQKLRPGRIIASLVILCLVSMLILGVNGRFPGLALGCAGGMLAGMAFALLGLRHTKFETTEEGHFFTPNTYIGLALSALLLGRLLWRMSAQGPAFAGDPQAMQDHPGMQNPQAFQSPWTMFIVGLNMGYYLAYYIGLFIHTHDKKPGPTV